jgi:N6-adenosine-specific RNA methylase IME4
MMLARPEPAADPFAGLPRGHFGAILADPPWSYSCFSPKGERRSAKNHYDVMELGDLTQLRVQDLAAPDCHLFMWATGPNLPQALFLMDWWGFRYSALAFIWIKTNPRQAGALFLDEFDSFHVGMGHTTRHNVELVLLGRHGSPKRLRKDVRELIISPRREHSRKPDEVAERIELYAAGPYLELFARTTRPGWTCWGNETTRFSESDHAGAVPAAPADDAGLHGRGAHQGAQP